MEKSNELSKKTISGLGWSVAAKFSRQAIQLVFQIVLARILSPKEFGLIAMTVVFTTLADIFKNMGLGQALIQKKEYDNGHLSTVFWFNIFMGLIIFLLFQGIAPFIASFYNEPALTQVVKWFALIYFIGSCNIVQEALMQKQLQFKRLFVIETVSVTLSGIIALVVALRGGGVWALVVQFLAITILSSIILWITSKWKPSFIFNKKKLKELQGFGFNLLGHDLLSFVSRNIDNFLVGKYIGATALGIYSRAYVLMLQPVNLANQVLARVMFPVFSLLQHDIPSIKRAYLKSTRMLAFITFPAITVILVLAEPIIQIMLGSQWLEVAGILQIFCIYCLLDSVGVTTTWLFKALGRTDIMFRWAIYYTIVLVTAIVVGLQWGITGVAWSYVFAYLIFLWIPGWYIAFRLIGLSVWEMFRNLAGAFLASALMGTLIWFIHQRVFEGGRSWQTLLILLTVAVIVYFIISIVVNRPTIQTTTKLIRKKYSIG